MWRLCIAALLVVAVCGCGAGGSDRAARSVPSSSTVAPVPTTVTTAPLPSVPSVPTIPPVATIGVLPPDLDATFAVVLERTDVRHADEAGFWYLTLTRSNGYAFGRAPRDPDQNTGVITAANGTITFSAEHGEGPCLGAGTYRWTESEGAVTFSVVEDPCGVRVAQPRPGRTAAAPAGRTRAPRRTRRRGEGAALVVSVV